MKPIIRTGMAFMAIASVITLFSCQKTSLSESNLETSGADVRTLSVSGAELLANRTEISTASIPALCGTSTTKNFLKNAANFGNVQIGNDANNYYITVTGTGGYQIKDIRMYVGTETGIPVNDGNGMPKHNEFPIQKNFGSPYPTTWSLQIPIADLGNKPWLSVRVSFVNSSGTQAIWSEGIGFPPSNNGSKFSFDQQVCIVDEGCAYGQGYWFGNGNQSWPDVNGVNDGDVTIGDEHYSRAQARAIWWANNGQCPGIPNAKKAFAFVAAIKLSGSNVKGNAGLWVDLALADSWLASLDRLSPDNICSHPTAPVNIMDAVARLGAWMDEHNCE